MAKIMGHLKVKEYNQWKNTFDSMRPVRKDFGSTGEKIFRADGNTNEVLVMLDWDNEEKAKKFTKSQEIKDAMQRAGVVDSNFFFLD